MKILMVTPFYFPTVGGTEVFIENITSQLIQKKIHVDIMTFDNSRPWSPLAKEIIERINGLDVIKIPASDVPERLHLRRLMISRIPTRFADRFKEYDVIHFHNDADLSFPLSSFTVKRPKIFHCHCISMNYDIYRRSFVSRYMLRNTANLYIAVSKYTALLLEDLGIRKTRIKTLHNGVDISRFKPGMKKRAENLLLFVGRLDPFKGLHFLLRSLEYLEKPVQLVVVGPLSWNQGYNKEILTLIKRISEKTIHKVTYMGTQKPDVILKLYREATILILPSTAESLGIVILEALACGTPVIASNVGGIPEIIQNNKNGILVPAGNPVELAKRIRCLLDDESLRKKFSEEGRRCVIEKFSYELIVEKLLEVYDQLI